MLSQEIKDVVENLRAWAEAIESFDKAFSERFQYQQFSCRLETEAQHFVDGWCALVGLEPKHVTVVPARTRGLLTVVFDSDMFGATTNAPTPLR